MVWNCHIIYEFEANYRPHNFRIVSNYFNLNYTSDRGWHELLARKYNYYNNKHLVVVLMSTKFSQGLSTHKICLKSNQLKHKMKAYKCTFRLFESIDFRTFNEPTCEGVSLYQIIESLAKALWNIKTKYIFNFAMTKIFERCYGELQRLNFTFKLNS